MADITFTGNLGSDAELKFSPQGNPRLSFSVADSKSKRNGDQWETVAEQWLRCTLWGPDAEHYSNLLLKGTRVQVFGEFYAREYEHNGAQRTSLDVTVRGLSVIPKRNNNGGSGQQGGGNYGGGYNTQPPAQQPADDPWGQTSGAPF